MLTSSLKPKLNSPSSASQLFTPSHPLLPLPAVTLRTAADELLVHPLIAIAHRSIRPTIAVTMTPNPSLPPVSLSTSSSSSSDPSSTNQPLLSAPITSSQLPPALGLTRSQVAAYSLSPSASSFPPPVFPSCIARPRVYSSCFDTISRSTFASIHQRRIDIQPVPGLLVCGRLVDSFAALDLRVSTILSYDCEDWPTLERYLAATNETHHNSIYKALLGAYPSSGRSSVIQRAEVAMDELDVLHQQLATNESRQSWFSQTREEMEGESGEGKQEGGETKAKEGEEKDKDKEKEKEKEKEAVELTDSDDDDPAIHTSEKKQDGDNPSTSSPQSPLSPLPSASSSPSLASTSLLACLRSRRYEVSIVRTTERPRSRLDSLAWGTNWANSKASPTQTTVCVVSYPRIILPPSIRSASLHLLSLLLHATQSAHQHSPSTYLHLLGSPLLRLLLDSVATLQRLYLRATSSAQDISDSALPFDAPSLLALASSSSGFSHRLLFSTLHLAQSVLLLTLSHPLDPSTRGPLSNAPVHPPSASFDQTIHPLPWCPGWFHTLRLRLAPLDAHYLSHTLSEPMPPPLIVPVSSLPYSSLVHQPLDPTTGSVGTWALLVSGLRFAKYVISLTLLTALLVLSPTPFLVMPCRFTALLSPNPLYLFACTFPND